MLPTQDNDLIDKSAEALRKNYMGYGKNHIVTSWKDTPYQDYWRTLVTAVLKIVEKKGYHKKD